VTVSTFDRKDGKLNSLLDHVAALVKVDADLVVDDVPRLQGMTNRVVFGTHRGRSVAVKGFKNPGRRMREARALTMLAETGMVPSMIPIDHAYLLLTERLRGEALSAVRENLSDEQVTEIYRGMGIALGTIQRRSPRLESEETLRQWQAAGAADPEDDSYEDWSTLVDRALDKADEAFASPHVRELQADQRSKLRAAFEEISAARDELKDGEQFFFGTDFGANNMLVYEGRFERFVDLEISRHATEVFLLGTALGKVWRQEPDRPDCLQALIEGYGKGRGESLTKAMLERCARCSAFDQWKGFGSFFTLDEWPQWAYDLDQKGKIFRLLLNHIEQRHRATF
jgi:hypothetical protein